MEPSPKHEFWLRLDNAAKIYPAIQDDELTSVFRITTILKSAVKAKELLEAVKTIEDRFPYYKVILKAGFFWYYLEHQNKPIQVVPDGLPLCRAFNKNDNLFRILVKDNKISVEFSHILTDGTGGLEFLKSLLFAYFEKCGMLTNDPDHLYHLPKTLSREEYEDAFNRYFQKIDAPALKSTKAFHLQYPLGGYFRTLTATIPLHSILQPAKEAGVSLTVYLTAIYLQTLQGIYENLTILEKRQAHKSIRIQVPINLRKVFPSKTMRNFSLYALPEIDMRLGHYSFEEILKTVYHQLQLQTDVKLINKTISRHVSGERNLMVKILPLHIKSLILSEMYSLGTRRYSGVVTNFGKIELPQNVSAQIDKIIFVPPPPNRRLKVNLGVCSFQDQLILNFGSITESRELEKNFFRFITSRGIPVKILSHSEL
ncbi:MAG: hypothetical protein KG003_03580 [Bacteroidetes bacterium]|nr:hypothetical protein [Bacteroidota bacterium]